MMAVQDNLMTLKFNLIKDNNEVSNLQTVKINQLVIAGWAGRDQKAVLDHIEELKAIGVPAPDSVPVFYRAATYLLTQHAHVEILGGETSGEVEPFIFKHNNQLWLSISSDHTDRKLEQSGIAQAKQICAKPVAREAWCLDDVSAYWDELIIRSYIIENDQSVLYQEGTLSALRTPLDLAMHYTSPHPVLAASKIGQVADYFIDGLAMLGGTIAVLGSIRPSSYFKMVLIDPVKNRTIEHAYQIISLPIIC